MALWGASALFLFFGYKPPKTRTQLHAIFLRELSSLVINMVIKPSPNT